MNVTDSFDGIEDGQPVKFSGSQSNMIIAIAGSISFVLLSLCAMYSGYKCFQNKKLRKMEKETAAHASDNTTNDVPKFDAWNSGNSDKKTTRPSEKTIASEETVVAMPKEQEEDKESIERSLKPEQYVKRAYSVVLILSIFILVVVNSFDRRRKYHLMAYLMLIFGINWNILFLSLLFTAKHLHAIRVKRKRLNVSQFLFVPYMYEEDEHRLIFSISELIGISGSNTEKYYALSTYTMTAICYCAALIKWSEEQSDEFTKLDVELLLFLVSNFGTLMIATWNLEPHTFGYLAHYTAAGLCLSGNPIAFALQQNFSVLSIVLMAITYFGFIEWVVFTFSLPKKHNDLVVVHKLSQLSIINEDIVFTFVSVIGTLFVYNL